MTQATRRWMGANGWSIVAVTLIAGCLCGTEARAQAAPPVAPPAEAPKPETPKPDAPPAAAPQPAAPQSAAPQPAAHPESPKAPIRKPNRAVPLDVDVLSEKVARYPNNPYLMNELGNRLLSIGRRQEAEDWFEKAVDEDEEFAAAWNNLGVVRWTLGHPSSAESAYREALRIQPTYALAWYNLGVVLDAQNKYDEAIKSYEKAFVLDPGLLDVKKNPQVVSNHRIPAVMSQTYIDRGGTVVFPTESSYPDKN
ncbi:MAG TPA: tetratricopeptide repeat protein [Patescibacteria group bacterium]|nr:tetratricopeptide repeat protein [Patescibacteria group bacterium]